MTTPQPHQLTDAVRRAIADHRMLPQPGCKVIVAVSGGADSLALLCVLHELRYECVAAHCNFHLRGEESNRDMTHVVNVCDRLGVDLCLHHFNAAEHARSRGISIEMACRELRYDWFNSLLDAHKAPAVAVAHHRDDNTETFLLNLLRGTGIAGLTGMSPCRGNIIRPMLRATRAMAEDYLRSRGLEWVTDSSNLSNEFRRNALRNVVLPAIRAHFPDADTTLTATVDHLRQAELLYREIVEAKRSRYVDSQGNIDIASLRGAEEAAPTLLHEWLAPMGFSMAQLTDMLRCAARSGASFSSSKARAVISHGILMVEHTAAPAPAPDAFPVDLAHDILAPIHITISSQPVSAFRPERNPNIMYLDSEVMDGEPRFELRRWRHGDRMTPYGLRGEKKLSDIFSNRRLSVFDKQRLWVLTRNDVILWVPGLRASAHFPVLPSTRRFLTLRYIHH